MLLAQRSWQSAKGGEGNCGKEALSRGLIYLFLTCRGPLHNVVMPLHNHQTGSPVQIRICQTGLGADATNLVSHLIYTFECESMRITFASVDRPVHTAIGSDLD